MARIDALADELDRAEAELKRIARLGGSDDLYALLKASGLSFWQPGQELTEGLTKDTYRPPPR